MRTLLATVTCVALFVVAPAQVAAALLPGFESESPGCPFGIPLVPGTKCPPAEQIDPGEAEEDSAANPRPPGAPLRTTPPPYSAHSMLFACCSPAGVMQQTFATARAAHAGYVRLDVNLRGVFTVRRGRPRKPNWEGVDRIATLARRYRVPVVAVLTHVPDHITTCTANHQTSCPAGDVESYGRYAGLIAERLEGVANHLEIVNEPDGRWAFKGSPQEYARMLDAAYRHIKHRVPSAKVLLGGLMGHDRNWVAAMLDTPGADAIGRFDIANVHLRGEARTLPRAVRGWRVFFAARGFRGPLWVTEHGYPGKTEFQRDRRFRGGERAQAAYLARSLPALRRAGAGQVFVTLRDSWPDEFVGEYASEGVVNLAKRSPFAVRRKAAFETVKRLNHRWARVRRLRDLRLRHLRAAARHRRAGRRALARRHLRLARRYARALRALR